MEIFTYQDYLKYQKLLEGQREAIVNILREDEETYKLSNERINNDHDKVFRSVLDDKREVAKFINKTLKLEIPIMEEELEKYNSSFVTMGLKNQEADIIYKLKGKDIFFLIEHQTKMDYTMPLRILEYSLEIMKSAIDKKKLGKKDYQLPTVISIVLYSGRRKWKVKNQIQKAQLKLEGDKNIEFGRYNVIDINNYTEEELLQEESFLSKVMLIEKARYTDNLAVRLEEIVGEINSKKEVYSKEQKELLIRIIELVLNSKLKQEESNKLIKSLKEGSGQMLAVLEMIDEENKRIFRRGERKGEKRGKEMAKLETAKKLLVAKVPIKIIMEATELSEEEISKLKG